MPYQDELLEGEVVSLWVGDFEDASALADYYGHPFESDFGFLLDDEDWPAMAKAFTESRLSRPPNAPPVPKLEIRELLDALPLSEDWIDEAEQCCRNRGFDAARIAMVFPHLRYRPDLCRNPSAPMQFIGTFPWPSGREDWKERLKLQVISPPFPILRGQVFGNNIQGGGVGDLYSWKGRVHLETWKGFAAREELAGQFMSFRFSAAPEGDLTLGVEPQDIRKSTFKPTHAQARAFQYLLDNQQAMRKAVLHGIYSVYDKWRDNYYGQIFSRDGKINQTGWECPDLLPRENMPKLSNPEDLARVISPSSVHVLGKEVEGFTRVGFGFDCKWDDEHGLGVLTHKGHVVEVGQADTAFTDVS